MIEKHHTADSDLQRNAQARVSNQCNFRMLETGIEPDWVLSSDYVLTQTDEPVIA